MDIFKKPVKTCINGLDCLRSEVSMPLGSEPISTESEDFSEDSIMSVISSNSQEWFGRSFTVEEVKKKYKQNSVHGFLTGILFYKNNFEFEIQIKEPKEKSFFEEPVVESLIEIQEPSEPVTEIPSEPLTEPVTEIVTEIPSEPLTETLVEPVVESSDVMVSGQTVEVDFGQRWVKAKILSYDSEGDTYTVMFSSGQKLEKVPKEDIREIKTRMNKSALKQIRADLDSAVSLKDYDKAYKLTEIIKQFNRL